MQLFYLNDAEMDSVMSDFQKVQSMSLISVSVPIDAYNAKSSNFGGRDETKGPT
jgi:hypothetical protein